MGHSLTTQSKVVAEPYSTRAMVTLLGVPKAITENALVSTYGSRRHLSIWPVCNQETADKYLAAIAISLLDNEIIENPAIWLRAQVAALRPDLSDAVRMSDSRALHIYRYADVSRPSYVSGHTVWIGDAGHAMSPQFGLGASLAMDDACELARHLRGNSNTASALGAFDTQQRAFHTPIQSKSRMVTPLLQSAGAMSRFTREIALRSFGREGIHAIHRLRR